MQTKRLTNFTWEIESHGENDTAEVGGWLARRCEAPSAVLLEGPLGSGKTVLARAFLRQKGVVVPIKSPTYDVVHRYRLPDGTEVCHADLYRISSADELDFLDLPAADEPGTLVLAEWGEWLSEDYPNHIAVKLSILKGDVRRLLISVQGRKAPAWVALWEEAAR